MSYKLSIYSANAFKEFLLPAIDNADSSITVSKTIFALAEDVIIPLEVLNGQWFIRKEGISMVYTASGEKFSGQPLKNGDLLNLTLSNGQLLNMIVEEIEDSFVVYKKYDISNTELIRIGKNENCDIRYDFLNLISREHGSIRKNGNQYIVEDTSANGIFINSVRMAGNWQLSFGDCIDIFGLRIVFLGNALAINEGAAGLNIRAGILPLYRQDAVKTVDLPENAKVEPVLFHRSPRKVYKLENDVVEIEGPPNAKEKDRQPLSMVIGPSLTMSLPMLLGCALAIYSTQANGGGNGAFMYTGLVTAVASALIGTAWTLINIRYNKKKNREEEMHRFEAYSEYLIKCTELIKSKYEKNTAALREMYPSAEDCCKYTENSIELWNRNVSHCDVLFERLGMGDVPFQVTVDIPREKFTMANDSLAEKPRMIRDSYRTLHEVPVGVDFLKHKLVGVFGGEKKQGAIAVLYNIVAQIAANNCYTDVKMAFIYDAKKYDNINTWSFAKWLPHVWSEDKKIRYVAKDKSEASDVLYELTKVLRIRQEESGEFGGDKEKLPRPYYILFVADTEFMEGELISKYVFEPKEEYGLTTVLLEDAYEKLPNTCDYLIQNDSDFQGAYSINDDDSERLKITFDNIAEVSLEELGRRLSNIEVNEVETGGEIPNALTFFEMYGVNCLEELMVSNRWRKNRTYESMKALIGQKAGGAACYLDVHEKYHGPHGLVAGTTGSGKSETLQTYMLSLAINFSPDDIGFFVIDYKGGGMANLFSGLPHMIGQISNLSGNQVRRAMVSIKSENMRRQRVFNEHGVNNINLYTKLYKNKEASEPIPHMFIVIDEFAELKREEPDFMRELISVAQVGRSLGVHLILATQKPSGTVDDNIWSNSKFKLCLRVQDKQDSNDMLHKADAAYITQAGRCYLQVGNDELYELFQSGFSGAVYNDDEDSVKTDIARMLSDTGRAALIGSRAKIKQKYIKKKEWIRMLVELLREAAAKLEIVPEKEDIALADRDRLIREVFRIMESKNVEYSDSEYNVRRLEDLLQVYGAVYETEDAAIDVETLVDKVIDTAEKTGKKLPEKKEKTQLDAIVEHLAQVAKDNGYNHNLQLWLPVLPKELYLDELKGYSQTAYANHTWPQKERTWSLNVYIGLCDDPVNQAQDPLIMDLAANGHYAVCGTVVSGKSTFLQTFVYSMICKYTPQEINIYGIDYGSKMLSAFEQAPHVGGIIYENENDRLAKCITMISGILEDRKTLFRGGNYSQYVQANGVTIPAIIIVLDNFAGFRSQTNNVYDDFFIQLAKDGASYGIYIVLAAAGFDTLEIPNRIGDNFRTVISLEMGDKFQYMNVMRTMNIDVMPEENVKGRGLVKIGESLLEYQTALALRAEDDFRRLEAIGELAKDMRESWAGKRARRIPEIPENFIWSEFAETEEVQKMLQDDRHLPVGYDTRSVSVYGVDLSATYCYLLSGKSRTGKTNMLKVMIQSAALKGGKITVIDFAGELNALCGRLEANYVTDDESLYRFFKDDLIPEFKKRNGMKRAWIAEGMSDEEIYSSMNGEERMYIFIADIQEFVKHIYSPAEGIGDMKAAAENLLDKGRLHNIFWIGCLKQEDFDTVSGRRAFNIFVGYKKGVHFGGNVSAQRIFNFDYIPYQEKDKAEKAGTAMLPASEEETVRKAAIPLCKG